MGVRRPGLTSLLLLLLAALPIAGADEATYNLKLLSNHAPDLTDLESFCHSVTSRWETNDEKAAALAYWFGVLGNQSSPPYDWMPVEPILHFNTTMQAQCAFWTALYDAVGEGGMGWVGRHYETGDHTIPELEYDGKRHYLDNTYKFFPLACDGKTILGITDLDKVAGPCERGPECKYHWLLYHTPEAITEDRDGYTPSKPDRALLIGDDTSLIRAWLSGSWLRRDAVSRAYFARTLDDDWIKAHWKEFVTEGCHSIYRYTLNLRPGEEYTRYWSHQGSTPDYFYPDGTGQDPDDSLNQRANGMWLFRPDLHSDASFESTFDIARSESPLVHPRAAGQEAQVVVALQSANVTTGSVVLADVVRRTEADSVVIEASSNGGHSWLPVWENGARGKVHVEESIGDNVRGTFAGGDWRPVLDYLVRVRMTAAASPLDAGLNSITIKTITVANRMALPSLDLGRNFITVDYDRSRQHETLSLRPLLKKDLYQRDAVEWTNVGTLDKQDSWSAVLFANNADEEGHVTFELEAPRPIFRLRMGGSLWIARQAVKTDYVRYQYRLFTGSWGEWRDAGLFNWDTRDNYHRRRNQSKYVEVEVNTPGVTKVQFKFVFRSPAADAQGAGANLLRMEVDYPSLYVTPAPVEVTYNWTEYYEPLPADPDAGGVTRRHTERVASFPHSYQINTGGDVRPRMNWVRVNLVGSSPEPSTPGYSDGRDVGASFEIPSVHYVWGNLLSQGKPYTVSRAPDADAFRAEGDDQELTDGLVQEPQVEGPWPATCLAHWSAGVGTVAVTVDLGAQSTVGGARLDAFYRPPKDRFPNSVIVETSLDGETFTPQGRDSHHAARYALNGWPADWPLYPRFDSPPWGDFPNYGLRGNYIFLPFAEPVKARYVRFLVEEQPGYGLMVSEVEAWDRLERVPWTPRLAHDPR